MISGAHCIGYGTDPDANRAFFGDVLEVPNVDVGLEWLIFGLPPRKSRSIPQTGTSTRALPDVRRHRGVCRGDEGAANQLRSSAG